MRAPVLLVVLALAGCELEEVTIVEPEDVVVAEAHVQVFQGPDPATRMTAFLHRTLGASGESRPVPGARVRITVPGRVTFEMAETDPVECVATTPVGGDGTCYRVSPFAAGRVGPGDTLTLRIDLPSGGVLESAAVLPGPFRLRAADAGTACTLEPLQPLELAWSPAEGAWAYVNEASIAGLGPALEPLGITVEPEQDPLYLLGLSVSAADTTIVFPGEFGVFNRFELDQELSLALQRGLPPTTWAEVTISAADRNYVNWVRGGNFNPSGQVRVPSVRGDGTGVFGATVTSAVEVVTPGSPRAPAPPCPGERPPPPEPTGGR